MKQRRRWVHVLACACVLAVMVYAAPANAVGTSFTVVVLPDTQRYTDANAPATQAQTFKQQTEWIKDNIAAQNIVFATHEGDLVQNGAQFPVEWQRADAAMDVLDGVVPYSVVIGNRDFDEPNEFASGTGSYTQYFGPQRYAGRTWFGGASANGRNTYQLFNGGGWRFLHLAPEYEVPDAAITWAQQVIDQHRRVPTIVTTHAYQSDAEAGRSAPARYHNNGDRIWQKLVKRNKQIFMVLNGHFCKVDGERHQVSTNDAGQPVFEMVANYQAHANGGNGYLRLLRFEPALNRIRVLTYSPTRNNFVDDGDSAFSLGDDFGERFGPPVPLRQQIRLPLLRTAPR